MQPDAAADSVAVRPQAEPVTPPESCQCRLPTFADLTSVLPLLQVLELREGRQDKEDHAADVSKLVEGLKKERDVLVKKHKVMEQGLKVSARVFWDCLALQTSLSCCDASSQCGVLWAWGQRSF